MADTRPNIRIQSGAWVDVYSASALPIGTQLFIENVGDSDLFLAVSLTQPDPDHDSYNVLSRKGDGILMNNDGDSGVWAFSNNQDGKINVSSTKAPSGFSPAKQSLLYDSLGNPISSYMGALDIHFKEVHTQIVNELFHFHTGTITTIAVAVIAGDISITVVDATGFTVGGNIQINNGQIETTFPVITALPGGNVLTLDRPLDFNYDIGDEVEVVHANIRDDIGTLLAPVSHIVMPEPGKIWFINRIIFAMTHTVASSDDKFGGIGALTNGMVLRANIGGQNFSFTNWKTNEDIILDMFDVTYSDKAGPSLFGTSGRGSFTRVGVLVELNGSNGDFLELLTQDDLTGLASYFINAQGYVEDIP